MNLSGYHLPALLQVIYAVPARRVYFTLKLTGAELNVPKEFAFRHIAALFI